MILSGNGASPGVAIGRALVYNSETYSPEETYFEPGQEEAHLQEYEVALCSAARELDDVIKRLKGEKSDEWKIFAAHKEILDDAEMDEEIRNSIGIDRAMPDFAVNSVYSTYAALLSSAADELIAGRAADLLDVRARLLRLLHGDAKRDLSALSEDVIVVAHDLIPSDTATMDREKVLGIVTETGGATSHAAILARSFKIPAVLGVENAVKSLQNGELCIVDALSGAVIVQPMEKQVCAYEQKRLAYLEKTRLADTFLQSETVLADGTKIEIGLNIGSDDPSEYYECCDFVGLFRSEFLYMEAEQLPTEEQQYNAYARVIAQAKGRPVTLRTLDIGGDKTLKYMKLPHEDNPFLGKRALRLCLDQTALFQTQLRAALRASALGKLQLMFPMVGTLDDIRAAKSAVRSAEETLRQEGIPFDEHMKIGIMIEIPSIAETADLAAREVDFASIGTNDLTQYFHAVDRMNADVGKYYQNYSPAMFRLLGRIIEAFQKEKKPLSVCGEMGGDPMAASVLVGLGLRKLSMGGANIARVKQALSGAELQHLQEIAATVRRLATQNEIMDYLRRQLK